MAFLILALLSFATMGVLHKLGDRMHAHPVLVATLCMGVAALLNGAKMALVPGSGLQSVPPIVPLMALPFRRRGGAGPLALSEGLAARANRYRLADRQPLIRGSHPVFGDRLP